MTGFNGTGVRGDGLDLVRPRTSEFGSVAAPSGGERVWFAVSIDDPTTALAPTEPDSSVSVEVPGDAVGRV
jgi:hypothetical protein